MRATRHVRPDVAFDADESDPIPSPVAVLALWIRRVRLRRELAGLEARQLRDVGLDPAVIRREVAKPFWIG